MKLLQPLKCKPIGKKVTTNGIRLRISFCGEGLQWLMLSMGSFYALIHLLMLLFYYLFICL